MIYFKSGVLSKKEKNEIEFIISEIPDEFQDFYITKDNNRLFIHNNANLLFQTVKYGNKLIWSYEDGLIILIGFNDKAPRKYIKILSRTDHNAGRLLKILFWNYRKEMWAKIKKNNHVLDILKENKFYFVGSRGREILLCRKEVRRKEYAINYKDTDKD